MAERVPPWWERDPGEAMRQARSREAAARLKDGRIKVPLACQFCQGSVRPAGEVSLECFSCGRLTGVETAHRIRRQKMVAIIRDGVDVPLRGSGGRGRVG